MSKNGKMKSNRREHILQESAMLFREKGFAGATMRDIADRVGIEAGSMYNHIASKKDVLEAICFRIADVYLSQLDEIDVLYDSPAEKIEALIRLHIRIIITDGPCVFVANNEWKAMEGTKLAEFKTMRTTYESRCKAMLSEGITAGAFESVDADVALYTLLSSIRWVEQWYKSGRSIDDETLENDIVTLVMGGLMHG